MIFKNNVKDSNIMKKDGMERKSKLELKYKMSPIKDANSFIEVIGDIKKLVQCYNGLVKGVVHNHIQIEQMIQEIIKPSNIITLKSDFDDKINNLKKETESKIESKFNQLNSKLNQMQSKISKNIPAEIKQLDDGSRKLERHLNEVEEKLSGLVTNITSKIEEAYESKINNIKNEMEEKFNHLINSRLDQIQSQISTQESTSKSQETVPVKPELKIEEIITQTKKKEQEDFKQDKETMGQCFNATQYWFNQGELLISEIKNIDISARDKIENSKKILDGFPDELKNELKNSQEGLNLIGRMLNRLVEPGDQLNSFSQKIEFEEKLKELDKNELKNSLANEVDEKSAQKKIDKKLKNIGMANYRVVSNFKEIIKKREKIFLAFLTGKVLPILDGVIDGQRQLDQSMEGMKKKYSQKQLELDNWFKTYIELQKELLLSLEKIGIHQMSINIGTKIDFECHEPIQVEPDLEKENEQIKEVIREGYKYTQQDKSNHVLRVAQVIVVKNEK